MSCACPTDIRYPVCLLWHLSSFNSLQTPQGNRGASNRASYISPLVCSGDITKGHVENLVECPSFRLCVAWITLPPINMEPHRGFQGPPNVRFHIGGRVSCIHTMPDPLVVNLQDAPLHCQRVAPQAPLCFHAAQLHERRTSDARTRARTRAPPGPHHTTPREHTNHTPGCINPPLPHTQTDRNEDAQTRKQMEIATH